MELSVVVLQVDEFGWDTTRWATAAESTKREIHRAAAHILYS